MVKSAKEIALAVVTELGLPIFPCNPGFIDPKKNKTPLVTSGFKAATTDIDSIVQLVAKIPRCSYRCSHRKM